MIRRIKEIKAVLGLIAFLWIVHAISTFIPLRQFGIHPRTLKGLIGIPASAFLHVDINHLIGNSISLLIFGIVFAVFKGRDTLKTAGLIILGSGFFTWCIGREANHIGASGLVFGLYGYLVAYGFYAKNIPALLVSIVMIITYGSIMLGVLPTNHFISWEAHISGFVFGGYLARYRASRPIRSEP